MTYPTEFGRMAIALLSSKKCEYVSKIFKIHSTKRRKQNKNKFNPNEVPKMWKVERKCW